ncbi:MAG: hypothetical protein N3E45_14870 [Oscillatoriaceae bacterium SKW80]|nr:hypothetical protein [Oscillatoriaceae bacterium SKYG93]MCX8122081.1 hypothetical protein [Oscillatoriaceae bacterium SKW80]MDW8454368.1 hypothetical protein [Oscillatoriaceae cyanobacterium SKYGB_i_bin93]HIK29232.1 hypothetical protein [Oscillatoriaceae cyanobacterium M7585_C2015_266]
MIAERTEGFETSAQILRLAHTLPQSFLPTASAGGKRQTLASPQWLGESCGRESACSLRASSRRRDSGASGTSASFIQKNFWRRGISPPGKALVAYRTLEKSDFRRLQQTDKAKPLADGV